MLPTSISFEPNATGLPEQGKPILDDVIAAMMAGPNFRVMIIGYASSTSEEAPAISQARRVSLARVLAVRAYRIEHGMKSPRIDVRAMGTHGGSPDRVDIVTLDQ
jgi:outer membrane protein OmpA-like peptidoglycan-associated protein